MLLTLTIYLGIHANIPFQFIFVVFFAESFDGRGQIFMQQRFGIHPKRSNAERIVAQCFDAGCTPFGLQPWQFVALVDFSRSNPHIDLDDFVRHWDEEKST